MWKCWCSLLHAIISIQLPSSVHISETFRSSSSHMPTTAFCWESKKYIRRQTYKEFSEIIFQPCISEQINLFMTLTWLPEFKFSGITFNTTHRAKALPVPLSFVYLPTSVTISVPTVHLTCCQKGTFMFSSLCPFMNAQIFRCPSSSGKKKAGPPCDFSPFLKCCSDCKCLIKKYEVLLSFFN